MPRQTIAVKEDQMEACPRCGGNGIIGERAGRPVPCPACGGDGRIGETALRAYQNRETRRHDGYSDEVEFLPGGREATRVSLDSLVVTRPAFTAAGLGVAGTTAYDDSAVRPGHVIVRYIEGTSPPRYRVVGGVNNLPAHLNGQTVPVEVVTDNPDTAPIGAAVDLTNQGRDES